MINRERYNLKVGWALQGMHGQGSGVHIYIMCEWSWQPCFCSVALHTIGVFLLRFWLGRIRNSAVFAGGHVSIRMQVDLGSVKCALVVCDTQWRGCSSSEESGEEHLAAADYLRLDSMVGCSFPATPPQLGYQTDNASECDRDTAFTCLQRPFPLGQAEGRACVSLSHCMCEPKQLHAVKRAHPRLQGCSGFYMRNNCRVRLSSESWRHHVQILVAQLNIRTALEVCPFSLA